jgi:heterodisulfide reductase subunit A
MPPLDSQAIVTCRINRKFGDGMTDRTNNGISTPHILVVGAGVTGLRTALDLAEMGYYVDLIDKAPITGGLIMQLEKQFPSNHCGLCRLRPQIRRDESADGCLRRGLIHQRVTFHPQTQLKSLDGQPGQLSAVLETVPTGVDPNLCTGCGQCETACPESSADPFNAGLNNRKAIHPTSPFAPLGARKIDWNACTKCGACVDACPTKAISLESDTQTQELKSVALVLLAHGRTIYDACDTDLYGCNVLPNVITSTTYERITSPLGPFGGVSPDGLPYRPSDQQEAQKIAWVQCVGSRNVMMGADYCSSACCMFALKEAMRTRELSNQQCETTIFYMDMRTFGRDWQRYRDQAEQDGVRLVRCRVHSVDPGEEPGQAVVRYITDHGELMTEIFDLVVLSTGQAPGEANAPHPLADHDGVLIADSAQGLTDIAESLISADNLAAQAAKALKDLGLEPKKEAVPEAALPDKDQVSTILAAFLSPVEEDLDWPALEKGLSSEVKLAKVVTPLGNQALDAVADKVKEIRPDRVLLITPAANMIPPLAEIANGIGMEPQFVDTIHYGAVLWNQPDPARRAVTLIPRLRAGVERLKARKKSPIKPRIVGKSALVVGTGPAGLSAALTLAGSGIKVTLVEKENTVAPTMSRLRHQEDRAIVEQMVQAAQTNDLIDIRLSTQVARMDLGAGDHEVSLRGPDGYDTIKVGSAILATGGALAQTNAYGLGESGNIITVNDLAARLNDADRQGDSINEAVFILCAGSREEPRNYCSRFCCPAALETAMAVKKKNPQARVTVFYRDVMTYGQSETLYTKARQAGVRFISFDLPDRPAISEESGSLTVTAHDPVLNETFTSQPDIIALAVGASPYPNQGLAGIFGLETTTDGFYQEGDVKWRPLDAPREGVYVCGLGRAPMRFEEALNQGKAAAGRALRLLWGEPRAGSHDTAFVIPGLCVRCLLCLPECPYNARSIDPNCGPVIVDPAACRGCGMCVSACPADAAVLGDYEEQGFDRVVRAVLNF